MIYALLPLVFDKVKMIHCSYAGCTGSIVVCISPLTSIMMDQTAKYSPKGLSTEFVGEAQTDSDVIRRVLKRQVQLT